LLLVSLAWFASPEALADDEHPDYQRDIEQSQALHPGQGVEIHHAMGDLDLIAGEGDQVRISAHVEVKGERAAEFGEQIKVEMDLQNTPLVIRTRYPEGKWQNLSYGVKMRVSIPRRHMVNAQLAFGSATLTGLEGKTEAQVSNGSIAAHDIHGALSIVCAFGAIDVQRCRGPVGLKGNCGKVSVSEVAGGDLDLESSFGDVLVQKVQGAATIACTNGGLSVHDVSGKAKLRTQFGNATIAKVGGPLDLQSGNGSLQVSEIEGDVTIGHTFGSVTLASVSGDVRAVVSNGSVIARSLSYQSRGRSDGSRVQIETTFGSIELALPDPPSLRLDAATTFGDIQSDVELSGLERHGSGAKCRCTLGGGKSDVRLRSNNGSIRLTSGRGPGRLPARERVVDASDR
jgi:hypothetical protein